MLAGVVTIDVAFAASSDQVSLSVFTAITCVAAPAAAAAFFIGAAPHVAGAQMFDPDGTGAKGTKTFGQLSTGLALTAGDFVLA